MFYYPSRIFPPRIVRDFQCGFPEKRRQQHRTLAQHTTQPISLLSKSLVLIARLSKETSIPLLKTAVHSVFPAVQKLPQQLTKELMYQSLALPHRVSVSSHLSIPDHAPAPIYTSLRVPPRVMSVPHGHEPHVRWSLGEQSDLVKLGNSLRFLDY